MRVLIVDDEPITRMDLREMLEREGYEVIGEAGDGFDAVQLCKEHRPNLVIMDVKMPLMDGLMASKMINEEQTANAIVLLTAFSDSEFVKEAKESGVSGYIIKPIDERAFIPAIEIAAARSRELLRIRKEYESIEKKLADRTIIERAKGILMCNKKLSEQEAYDYIHNLSRMKNVSMKKIADIILTSARSM